MYIKKSTASARVPDVIKEIVKDSEYSHKDAYLLGAGLICIGKAEAVKALINDDPNYKKAVKEKKCQMLEAEKRKLEDELEKEFNDDL